MVVQGEGWSEQKPMTPSRTALYALCREEPLLQRAGYPARGWLSPEASRGLYGTGPRVDSRSSSL